MKNGRTRQQSEVQLRVTWQPRAATTPALPSSVCQMNVTLLTGAAQRG